MRFDRDEWKKFLEEKEWETPKKPVKPKAQTNGRKQSKKEEHKLQEQIANLLVWNQFFVVRHNSSQGKREGGGYIFSYTLWNYHKNHRFRHAGLPDLQAIDMLTGRVYFIEVKRKGGAVRESQREFKGWCEKMNNVEHHVIDNIEDAEAIILRTRGIEARLSHKPKDVLAELGL